MMDIAAKAAARRNRTRRWRIAYWIPSWSQLRGAGELRVLRVSYVLLALIPIWHTATTLWNGFAERKEAAIRTALVAAASELNRELVRVESLIPSVADREMAKNATRTLSGGESKDLAQWTRSIAEFELQLREFGERIPELAGPISRFRSHVAALPSVVTLPRVPFDNKLRWIFVAMTAISIANILYGMFCPPTLRVVHRPDRQGHAHGLGDEIDWCLQLFKVAHEKDPEFQEQQTILVSTLLQSAREHNRDIVGSTPAKSVLALRTWLDTTLAPVRLCCAALYSGGLMITLGILAKTAWSVVCK